MTDYEKLHYKPSAQDRLNEFDKAINNIKDAIGNEFITMLEKLEKSITVLKQRTSK